MEILFEFMETLMMSDENAFTPHPSPLLKKTERSKEPSTQRPILNRFKQVSGVCCLSVTIIHPLFSPTSPSEGYCTTEIIRGPTLNGGTPDMSAGQFINTIKGYVDRHSMMYAANGVPTAQNFKENYEAGLQAVTDLARQEHPGDPAAEQRYRSHYIQQSGQQLHAENMTNQANWNILNAALDGPNALKSEQDLLTNPRLADAYNAILKTDPSAYRVVNNAINANALAMWDPPASAQTNQLHDTLNGMKDTDRA